MSGEPGWPRALGDLPGGRPAPSFPAPPPPPAPADEPDGPPDDEPPRKPDGRRPWLTLLWGVPVLVGSVFVLGLTVDAVRDRAAYRRAVPCTGDRTRDCVRDTTAKVLDFDTGGGKLQIDYRVRVDLGGRTEWASMPRRKPVYAAADVGDTVRVRLWEGEVARVTLDGAGSAETDESPLHEPFFGLWGVAGGAFAARALAEAVATGRRDGWFHRGYSLGSDSGVRRGLLTVWVGAAAGGFLVGSIDVYDVLAVAAVTLAAGAVTWRLTGRSASRDTAPAGTKRNPVAPSAPTRSQTHPGRLR